MIAIPFPLILAEIFIFWFAVSEWGFWTVLGVYLLPCLLGVLILGTIGRMAIMVLQSTVVRGQLPANKILHSAAIFISGILFLIPSFFARLLALILLLPGLRHIAVWKFKTYLGQQIAKGSARVFDFGAGGPFGFSTGSRTYDFRNQTYTNEEIREEREIYDAEVVDVTPLEITHEKKKSDS